MQDILLFIQHHPLLCFTLAAILILAVITELWRLRLRSAQLQPAEVVARLNHEQATVIDIRNVAAFATGHVTGAISLPAGQLRQNPAALRKYSAHPIILACATGTESGQIAAHLQKQGIQTMILAGGMRTWTDAGLPVIKSSSTGSSAA